MPIEMTLDMLPAGYAAGSARKGESVSVITRDFVTSEDGEMLISQLEEIPATLLAKVPGGIQPSMVDHFLAFIRPDKTVTLYVNELNMVTVARVKRAVKAGENLYEDDFADILRLELPDITFQRDQGFMFLFSIGWRKGLFYDLGPLSPEHPEIQYEVPVQLGACYSYLSQQGLFGITTDEWSQLIENGWFPFVTLKNATVRNMLSHVRNHWSVDDLLPKIREEVLNSTEQFSSRWGDNSFFAPHVEILSRAIERYRAEDYVSCNSIIYPRIEGLMRSLYSSTQSNPRPTTRRLVDSLVEARADEFHAHSLLVPKRFRDFLTGVVFAHFDDADAAVPVARHSVAHGVADSSDFSLKKATVGILAIDQICFLLPASARQREELSVPDTMARNPA